MNKLFLRPIIDIEDKKIFINEIQKAFQKAYEEEFGEYEKTILPTKDIEESFDSKGAEAYISLTEELLERNNMKYEKITKKTKIKLRGETNE